MWSFGVVVVDVLLEFSFELFFSFKGCSFDKILIECSPEFFHFSIGLGTIGLRVGAFDPISSSILSNGWCSFFWDSFVPNSGEQAPA